MSPEFGLLLLITLAVAALLSGAPVGLALSGAGLLTVALALATGLVQPEALLAYQVLPDRLLDGIAFNPTLLAIPLFLLMGSLLQSSGLIEDLLRPMRRQSRALPPSVVAVGGLLGASTGVVGASVTALGLLALPTLLKRGLSPGRAAGLVAAAGSLGQLVPPSIVLLILADQVSQLYTAAQYKAGNFAPDVISAGQVFGAALVPALLLILLYALYAGLALPALSSTAGAQTTQSSARASKRRHAYFHQVRCRALIALAALAGLAALVLGGILVGWFPPSDAAIIGVALASLLAALRQGLGWQKGLLVGALALAVTAWLFWDQRLYSGLLITALAWTILSQRGLANDALDRAIRLTGVIFFILLGAAVYALSLKIIGGDAVLQASLTPLLERDPRLLLAALLALMFLMGFFFEFLEIVLILLPAVGPVLFASPLDPLWISVLMALVLQTSFLTPPFGVALFYLKAVAPPTVTTLALYRGVWPYVGLQGLVLILVWVWPGIIVS